jgi:hypothetical protein
VRDVNWERHGERVARWHAKVVQERLNRPISRCGDVGWHRTLRLDRNHPASPHLIGELDHIDGEITRVSHMNIDVRLLNPGLILPHTRHAPFVGFRKPDADVTHLRTI